MSLTLGCMSGMYRLVIRWSLLTLAALGLGVVAGCAALHVRSVSSDPRAPAYELRGPSMAHLQAEAARLCPQGYDQPRQAQVQTRLSGEYAPTRWWNTAAAWLDDDEVQVQLSVVCKVATPP